MIRDSVGSLCEKASGPGAVSQRRRGLRAVADAPGETDRAEQRHLRAYIRCAETRVNPRGEHITAQILHPAIIRVIEGVSSLFGESFVVDVAEVRAEL